MTSGLPPHRSGKMFFVLSKVFWTLGNPANLLLVALCVGAVLLWTPWRRAGRRTIAVTALAGLAVSILPAGKMMIQHLENRFPVVRQLPEKVDGIVALGGVVNQFVTRARGQVAVGGSAERLTEFARLARLYPQAKLVFTGGSGDLIRQDAREGDVVAPLFRDLGLDPARVIIENNSRNTFENATMTRTLVGPGTDEIWIVITSAFHMPRAVGSFREAGWRVLPYPVDFMTPGDMTFTPTFNLRSGLSALSDGIHEWLGLAFYRLTGKSDALYPGPGETS